MLYSLWVTHHNYGQHASLDYGCCDLIVGYEKVSFSRNFSANAAVVFIFIFTFKARFTRLSKVVVASVPFFFSLFFCIGTGLLIERDLMQSFVIFRDFLSFHVTTPMHLSTRSKSEIQYIRWQDKWNVNTDLMVTYLQPCITQCPYKVSYHY